jgi:hypothetical protein
MELTEGGGERHDGAKTARRRQSGRLTRTRGWGKRGGVGAMECSARAHEGGQEGKEGGGRRSTLYR